MKTGDIDLSALGSGAVRFGSRRAGFGRKNLGPIDLSALERSPLREFMDHAEELQLADKYFCPVIGDHPGVGQCPNCPSVRLTPHVPGVLGVLEAPC